MQRLISISFVLHFLVWNTGPNTYLFHKSLYCFFLSRQSFICVHFSLDLIFFMILFLIHHINCYFACINIIDVDSLIGSILFHTWHNFIDISSLSQVPESFTFMFKVSSRDYSKTLFPRFDHFSIYAPFHLRGFLSLEPICIPCCRCDYQFYIIFLEHQYLLDHLQLILWLDHSIYLGQ